jgi:hypothetical protein
MEGTAGPSTSLRSMENRCPQGLKPVVFASYMYGLKPVPFSRFSLHMGGPKVISLRSHGTPHG